MGRTMYSAYLQACLCENNSLFQNTVLLKLKYYVTLFYEDIKCIGQTCLKTLCRCMLSCTGTTGSDSDDLKRDKAN